MYNYVIGLQDVMIKWREIVSKTYKMKTRKVSETKLNRETITSIPTWAMLQCVYWNNMMALTSYRNEMMIIKENALCTMHNTS